MRVVGYALLLLAVWNLIDNLIFASNFVVRGWQFNWHPLVGAFLALLGAFVLAALLINAFPTFEPRSDGLVMRGFIRPIVLPWARVAMLRSMELPGERYLVVLQYTGMPADAGAPGLLDAGRAGAAAGGVHQTRRSITLTISCG